MFGLGTSLTFTARLVLLFFCTVLTYVILKTKVFIKDRPSTLRTIGSVKPKGTSVGLLLVKREDAAKIIPALKLYL